jgi:hypothetical protein
MTSAWRRLVRRSDRVDGGISKSRLPIFDSTTKTHKPYIWQRVPVVSLHSPHVTSHCTPTPYATRCSRPPFAILDKTPAARHQPSVVLQCCHWSCDKAASELKSKAQTLSSHTSAATSRHTHKGWHIDNPRRILSTQDYLIGLTLCICRA